MDRELKPTYGEGERSDIGTFQSEKKNVNNNLSVPPSNVLIWKLEVSQVGLETDCFKTCASAARPTEVFGGDGLEPDDLQSSGSQDQLAAPRVEVLRKHIGG